MNLDDSHGHEGNLALVFSSPEWEINGEGGVPVVCVSLRSGWNNVYSKTSRILHQAVGLVPYTVVGDFFSYSRNARIQLGMVQD